MFFPTIHRWHIPASALRQSMQEMRRDGQCGNEGVALWLGNRTDGEACVEHLAFLRGPYVEKAPDRLMIDSRLMNDVTDVCVGLGVSLLAQIHSHGPWAGVDLSSVDHRYGIKAPHFLSLVAPDYARASEIAISECGVHVYEPNQGYRRMRDDEVQRRVHVEDRDVGYSIVGEEAQ